MAQRLLDRIWNRLADRYGEDDGGDCGCGTVGGDADGNPQAPESNTDEESKQGNTI